MQIRDNIGDRVAHSGDFLQPTLRNRSPSGSVIASDFPLPRVHAIGTDSRPARPFAARIRAAVSQLQVQQERHGVNQERSDCVLTPESRVGAAGVST